MAYATLLDIALGLTDDEYEAFRTRVATHIGARLRPDGTMACPACGGDFGPTMAMASLARYEDGCLPGAPLLAGACLDCGHVTTPKATPIDPELLAPLPGDARLM